MVILINSGIHAFKVEYTAGSRGFSKQFPTNSVVAMQNLVASEQISNRNFLAKNGVTIYDYERGTYFSLGTPVPTGNTMPFVFIGNNQKSGGFTSVSDTFSGSTTQSGMTFTKLGATPATIYGFTTSANTTMADGTIAVTVVGNNTFVNFSGANTTTQNVYAALTGSSSFSVFGITMAGQGATKINTGSTVTFYLSATTQQSTSDFAALQRLV